jgi:SAM-dependent methyltransferase
VRQVAIRLLRQTHLLRAAEAARFAYHGVRYAKENAEFVRDNPGFAVPPSWLRHDAHGHIRLQSYFDKGCAAAQSVATLVAEHSSGATVCEWGCGPGRIVRHLPKLLPGSKILATDYNQKSIEWCSQNIAGVTFRLNGLRPPLPFGRGTVDFLYAVSVLTHLSASVQREWVEECARVVRPGGIILMTVHGDRCITGLSAAELAAYRADQVVARGSVLEGSRVFVTYQNERQVRRLFNGMAIVAHNPPAAAALAGAQDTYVVRR